MNRRLVKTLSSISIIISSIIAMAVLPVGTAAGEQIYKVRFGEQTFNDYFNVGFKSFRYTERGYNSYYGANLLLVPCEKSTDTDCIDSLSYQINQSDIWIKAEIDNSWTFPSEGVPLIGSDKGSNVQFTIKNRFPTVSDELNNYPAGGATSIWMAPKASSSTKFRLFVNFNLVGSHPDPNSEKVKWNQFIAQVVPINLEGISDRDKTPSGSVVPNFGSISNLKVKLRVNILNQILNGWIHSRTVNPEISYSRDVNTGNYVEISGGPLSVPTAEAQLTEAQYRSVWENPYMKRRLNGYPVALPDPKSLWSLWNPTDGVEKGELLAWAAYEPYFSNVAVAERYMWKLVGQGNLNLRQFDTPNCVSDGKIVGILATNATQYSPTPPTYIESSQELAYQLAAPHFRNPNEEFKGSYSLIVSEKLAECIWGNDLSTANARVTILNNDGKSSVVTQTFKRQSGFYNFNINGFGFSAPTIRIKMTQDAEAEMPRPSTSPTATVEKPIRAKKSIICTKGKTTKKVTATAPKCPTGYKKAA